MQGLDELISILKEYKVDTWREDYSFESPDTYEDGSTQKYHGSGSFEKEVIAEGFQDFLDAIYHLRDKVTEGLDEKSI